jgi:hypothetical protein
VDPPDSPLAQPAAPTPATTIAAATTTTAATGDAASRSPNRMIPTNVPEVRGLRLLPLDLDDRRRDFDRELPNVGARNVGGLIVGAR